MTWTSRLAIFLVSALLSTGLYGQQQARPYLPKGVLTVDVLQWVAPARLVELSTKLQAAVRSDPDWFKAYAAKAPAGKPLPYNKRLGLTLAEFQEFLSLSGKLTTQKAGTATFDFSWRTPDILRIDTRGAYPELDGIEIDLGGKAVTTPIGKLADVTTIDNNDENAPTGPWKGFQWKYARYNSDSDAISTYIAFGRLTKTGEGIMLYKAKVIKQSKLTIDEDLIFNYPLN
jgi:hypothetical protein